MPIGTILSKIDQYLDQPHRYLTGDSRKLAIPKWQDIRNTDNAYTAKTHTCPDAYLPVLQSRFQFRLSLVMYAITSIYQNGLQSL